MVTRPEARERVYAAFDSERAYQNDKWGPRAATEDEHTPEEWLLYIQDYLTEAIHIAARTPDPNAQEKILHWMRKIGAMTVACMEQKGAPRREGY